MSKARIKFVATTTIGTVLLTLLYILPSWAAGLASDFSQVPKLSYSTYFGGSGNDTGFAIVTDDSGNSYLTGSTDSPEFSSLSGSNCFVAKFDSNGKLVWRKIIGGSGDDTCFSIAVDKQGSTYVTGSTDSIDFPVINPIQYKFGGGAQDAFIAKLDPKGSIVYTTYFGGSGNDTGFAIAVDPTGHAYIAGSTDSSELSTLGQTDGFIIKMSPTGNQREYFAILGGSGDDTPFSIAVDSSGNAYVTGSTDSSEQTFLTVRAYQPHFEGSQDAFVGKLNPTGTSFVYLTYFGGSGSDQGFAIATDKNGNAYITGSTDSSELAGLGGRDVFVAKFNPDGTERTDFALIGGQDDDAGFGIALDSMGNVYITGSTDSTNFTTTNALQKNLGGAQDIFVAKFDPDINLGGQKPSYSTFLGTSDNESAFGIATDKNGNAYVTGYTNSNHFPMVNTYQATSGGNGDAFVVKISNSVNPGSPILISSPAPTASTAPPNTGIASLTPAPTLISKFTQIKTPPTNQPSSNFDLKLILLIVLGVIGIGIIIMAIILIRKERVVDSNNL